MTRKTYMDAYNKKYKTSLKGMVYSIYHKQIRNSKTRGHLAPAYTKEELLKWVENQPHLEKLRKDWVDSNFNIELKPSIDRLDNSLGYTLTNIQLISWKENKELAYNATRSNTLYNSGLLNGGHRAVACFDLDGNYITSYISMAEAARDINGNHASISSCCRDTGNVRVHKDRIWCYIENIEKVKKVLTKTYLQNLKKAKAMANGYEVLLSIADKTLRFNTAKDAYTYLGISFKLWTKWVNNEPSPRKQKPHNLIIKLKDSYEPN